jgi:hypothetical protein
MNVINIIQKQKISFKQFATEFLTENHSNTIIFNATENTNF